MNMMRSAITILLEKEALHMRIKLDFAALRVALIFSSTFLIIIGLHSTSASAEEKQQQTELYCLSCHSNPELSIELPSGETLSLYISPEDIKESLHSPMGIECEACHTEITTFPHPELEYESKRELARAYYLACQKCHSDNYNETLDSMHANAATAGNLDAPICTDCHGAHYIKPPDQPRSLISDTCGNCHDEIYDIYKESIHGLALIEEDNPDVPVCTDCHGVHNIQDPRTVLFHIETPEMCADCHADEELMKRYGLTADVYNIYKLSWHGVDVSIYKAKWPTIWHESAVCTDCHGIHDILGADNPDSSVHPSNLLQTCQECHPSAGNNWTDAWTGHNEVSLERTPFLFYTKTFYDGFIPAVLWISGIYVILQIIRSTVERARRSL
jgi:nitrate/TMAO reductase-like tetraheme cytochrome c subunit